MVRVLSQKFHGMEIIRQLASHYRSGKANLGKDFFAPCLKYCTQYRRAVGYFSSGALIAWSEAIPHIATEDVVIKLIISPELSEQDKTTIKKAIDESERNKLRQIIADRIIEDALKLSKQPDSIVIRQQLLAWMIANDKLMLRFAFPQHIEQAEIFHKKIGIFDFPWGDKVAFTGSANESLSGHSRNYESIDVYRSWIAADEERVEIKVEEFQEAWEEKAIGLKILSLSSETIKFIRSYAPSKKPSIAPEITEIIAPTKPAKPNYHWRHQEEAVEKFLQIGHGVLEMATGTGKTRTTLKILSRLDDDKKIDGIIVTTDGKDLLDQWSKEVEKWSIEGSRPFRVLKHYDTHHQLESFANHPQGSLIVISRQKLSSLLSRIEKKERNRIFIVHDEVHGLGSPANVQQLTGEHESFGYRLGLSATPEREYDTEGTDFIFQEIGDVFFKFTLKEAIERGILCEFNYIALPYELTDSDKYRLKQVYQKKAARKKEGRPMSDREVWTDLSKVYKTAEQKPEVFAEFLQTNAQILKSTILFVETTEFGEQILEIIHNYTYRYRTYYSGEDQQSLRDFAKGDVDCLITCHRLSQGIDIQNLQNVILFSSARAKLETIQRIGRCLRTNPKRPDKKATIVDFIMQSNESDRISADEERYQWLSELSNIRRKE
ncbi:MAG: DEAD/DEAH box helicase family protein [Pleurocapsa sp.]